jgi:phospholipid/cholesterol/gamma-HCH transport system substrate-binding protein
MADQYKNMMIALFICAAAGIITFILLFIHPSVGDEKRTLFVRFTDVDKISVGTRVTYGGKPIGEVVAIREINDGTHRRLTRGNKVYLYELELRIDSGVHIFDNDEITSRTAGLLGEKSVAIQPQPTQPEQTPRILTDEIIYAQEAGSVEDTFKEFKAITHKFERILNNVNRIVEEMEADETFSSLSQISHNISTITKAMAEPQQISETLANIHKVSERFNSSWDTVELALNDLAATTSNTKDITQAINHPEKIEQILTNTQSLSSNLQLAGPKIAATVEAAYTAFKDIDNTVLEVQRAVSGVCRGEGTIGSLLMRDDFYLRITSLLNKAEVTFNDVNHYGLLFHLDKGWQRLRARRLNLLAKLSTPQEFRNYFDEEIDGVTTALSRVAMVLERNAALYPCGGLLDDNDFAKVYASLLRRVENMEEGLKMYNQQLVEQQVETTELRPNCRQGR